MSEASPGRTVVALPGTLCAPFIFDRLAIALAGAATVDAVSWMTFPGPWDLATVASRVAERIRAGQGGPVTVIGHSTGGAIAQQLTLDHPELVEDLVLLNTGPNMHSHGDVDAIIDRLRTSWGPELLGGILDRSFATPLSEEARAGFLEYAGAVDRRSALEILTSQRATDFSDRLGGIRCPVAVIHGTRDPTRSVAQAEEFAAAFPDALLSLLPCGHSPMFEEPEATAAVIRALSRT